MRPEEAGARSGGTLKSPRIERSSAMPSSEARVLIVGGGTVGLSAAVFLARRGVPALVVERHPSLSIHPRAIGAGVRSMELFRGIGLETALREAAAPLANKGGWVSV